MVENGPFGMRNKFIEKNLEVSRQRGSEDQQDRMSWFACRNSQCFGELGDLLGGRIELLMETHHPIRALVKGVIESHRGMIKIRSEIDNNK